MELKDYNEKLTVQYSNLKGSEFSCLELSGSKFVNADMSRIFINDANLSDLEIFEAQLGGAYIHGIGLPPVGHHAYREDQGEQRPLRFEQCELAGSTITSCNLRNVRIEDCEIEGLTINGINISELIGKYHGVDRLTKQVAEPVEILELPEIKLVGLTVTSPFAAHQPGRVDEMKQAFMERKNEIRRVVHPERYLSPHFTSEILFTYMICMEVEDLEDIPEGMIGFTIPARRYAKVKSKGDPYQAIHDYLKSNGMESNERALALELYRFENPVWPDETEVFVPIK